MRWLLLYYEDCLALEKKYPGIHASFLKGDFVVQHSGKKGRKGLKRFEKDYNKAAKSQSDIIGISRRKEVVVSGSIPIRELFFLPK